MQRKMAVELRSGEAKSVVKVIAPELRLRNIKSVRCDSNTGSEPC